MVFSPRARLAGQTLTIFTLANGQPGTAAGITSMFAPASASGSLCRTGMCARPEEMARKAGSMAAITRVMGSAARTCVSSKFSMVISSPLPGSPHAMCIVGHGASPAKGVCGLIRIKPGPIPRAPTCRTAAKSRRRA